MKTLGPGAHIDGFRLLECLHSGGMAHVYAVEYAVPRPPVPAEQAHGQAPDGDPQNPCQPAPGFAMVMKIPRMTVGDGAENIVGFEVERQLYPVLSGPHVPRFVAAGDLLRLPYLVIERIAGLSLQQWLDQGQPRDAANIARLGAKMAHAVHSLHQQNCCHLDLKPGNILMAEDGRAVLLDFGLSHHSHYPDLMAEELRQAVGSPAWIAPEQVVGVRGDLRSDIFAMGAILYEMATGVLPFGQPMTHGGMRQRLWLAPTPVRALSPHLPPWLQEVILRCLEPEAAQRYPTAAQLAFELENPDCVVLTERARRLKGLPLWAKLRRWVHAAGMHYQPSPLPTELIAQRPILMVAVPHEAANDATLYSLREAAARSMRLRPGARLACITVLSSTATSAQDPRRSETTLYRQHLERLRQWAQPLQLGHKGVSFHVLEARDVAQALVQYAQHNQVDLMILGAATHGLQLQRLIATVPMRVARDAPCTVILVKAQLPFSALLPASGPGPAQPPPDPH